MKFAISNIVWGAEADKAIYQVMKNLSFNGLEVAPTRVIPENPYDHLSYAKVWKDKMKKDYNFSIPSMQSIWYGKQEKIFGTDEERSILLDYTKKAIDFAAAIGCRNMVFGCPRNRNVPDMMNFQQAEKIAISFFKELGDYAFEKGTIISMEANPPIYNTNFINNTASAIVLVKAVASEGFKVNLDVGTMIENGESILRLKNEISLINHVHISEPGLKPIVKRRLHGELIDLLNDEKYEGYISIEMGKQDDVKCIEDTMIYVRDLVSDLR